MELPPCSIGLVTIQTGEARLKIWRSCRKFQFFTNQENLLQNLNCEMKCALQLLSRGHLMGALQSAPSVLNRDGVLLYLDFLLLGSLHNCLIFVSILFISDAQRITDEHIFGGRGKILCGKKFGRRQCVH